MKMEMKQYIYIPTQLQYFLLLTRWYLSCISQYTAGGSYKEAQRIWRCVL